MEIDKSTELVVANLVLPLVKDIVLPKIQAVINKFSFKNIDQVSIEENFQLYLSQRYEKYLTIDTLVFPNKQTLFKSIYEPLTIRIQDESRKKAEIKIKDYPTEFLPKYFRAIIEDTAGMGKSTITKKLFLSIIEQNAGIPILIELRQINKDNDFLKEVQSQLSFIGKPISIDIILKLLGEGEFIFLFDGFDEISKVDKEFVIKDLHRFIEKTNNNYFLITSRPEDSLVSFGDFQKFSVKPLNDKEAYSLINRYDSYSFKPFAKGLIKQLKNNQDDSVKEFLTNPFLVSLLYKSFEYKKDIPLKKCQFYRQVYDALFEAHDLSKEGYLKRDKHSNLHLDDFERVLRHIGYLTSIENKVEYDKNYIINIIDKAKKYVPELSFQSSDYLKDLLETVPLFKRDGNYIKWAHKSLQDYFAAKFIWVDARHSQTPILKKIYKDNDNRRFYNVLDLFYELDSNAFDNTILLWLLEEFQKYASTRYKKFQFISKDIWKQRIENSFYKDCVIAVTKQDEFEGIRKGNNTDSESYRKRVESLGYNCRHITFNYYENPRVVVLTFINNMPSIDTIIRLVSAKIPSLAKDNSHKVHLKQLNVLMEGEIFKVDDDKDNILNDERIFEQTNDLILSDYKLNYDSCLKKLSEIKGQYAKNLEGELTNW